METEDLSERCSELLEKIRNGLKELVQEEFPSCTLSPFKTMYLRLLSLFDEYMDEYLKSSEEKSVCSAGCGTCCRHWADDVYSFEAEIIADHMKETGMDTESFIKQAEEDSRILARIKALVRTRKNILKKSGIDEYDAALLSFYRMDRPCEFLDSKGSCSIYEVRPMMCRSFVNTCRPENCQPENISDPDSGTMIVWLDDECEELLQILHEKYSSEPEDMGLRSQVRKILALKK